MNNILDHFTGTPRPGQARILEQVQRNWWGTDVFIIRAPVGAGKSKLAHAIASWAGRGTVCTPTNVLVQQYLHDWPDLATMHYRSQHPSQADWDAHKAAVKAAPIKVANYMTYLANRMYSPTVIMDEAHNLIGTLQDMEGTKLWETQDPWPDWVCDTFTLLCWAKEAGYPKLVKLLETKETNYTIAMEWSELRGKPDRCLRVYPLTPRNNRPVFWPPRAVNKLVLMSATFDYEDLYDLGLEGRRVTVLDCDNPIPPDRRPVLYDPVVDMRYAKQDQQLPRLVEKLQALLAAHPTERGFVHCTYALARKLRKTALGRDPRLRWHAQANRNRCFNDWLAEGPESNSVFIGAGFEEGIDLAGWKAGWQVITKVMYPNKTDRAVAAKLRHRPRWYAWCAARSLLQSVGRVSRGPDDYGITYVLTSEFGLLYNKNRDMFPTNAINLEFKGI